MDSSKRVLESINTNKVPAKKTESKTIRLTVDLNQKDKDGCAIFNYQDLVKAEKNKLNSLNKDLNNGTLDPFQNEDEEALKKIALQYEEKYGASSMRYQTYTELGAGYDESDSFIDNTEACEEGVPEDIEPKRGGFYVNTGKLEYKSNYGYFDPKLNKRKLLSESESDEEECSSDEKRITKNTNGRCDKTQKFYPGDSTDIKLSNGKKNSNKTKKLKIKLTDEGSKERSTKSFPYAEVPDSSSKNMTGNNNTESKEPSSNNEESLELKVSGKERSKSSSNVESNSESPPKNLVTSKTSETKDVTASNETIVSKDINNPDTKKESSGSQSEVAVDKLENDSRDTNPALSESESSNSMDTVKGEPPKLPSELPSEILILITELRNIAMNYKSSLRKFFNDQTNPLLYRLESACRRNLSNSARRAVYSYLAHYVPYTKSTLVSKIKKIFVGTEKLELIITRLRSFNDTGLDVYDLIEPDIEEIKLLVQEAVQIKIRQYIVKSTKKRESLEAYMEEFLNNIASIWPNGSITGVLLHHFVLDDIKIEAEAYNLTYNASRVFLKTPNSPPTVLYNDGLLVQSQKNGTEHEEDVLKDCIIGTTGNRSIDEAICREMRTKDDKVLPLTQIITDKNQDLSVFMKISPKKQKTNVKKSEVVPSEVKGKSTKYCSTDEKVQMQLDQVMQDLVVLNQMSSDTTSSTNTKGFH